MMGEDSKHTDGKRVRVECFMLCDYATAENGKLNILGGGWEEIVPPGFPFELRVGVAVKLVVPGDLALQGLSLRIDAVNAAGEPFEMPLMDGRLRARFAGDAQAHAATPTDFAFQLASDTLMEFARPEQVTLRLFVGGEEAAITRFVVREPHVDES